MKKRICVDLDGTLCYETDNPPSGYANAKPIKDNVEYVRLLKRNGYKITIHTSRHVEDKEITIKWLKSHNVPFDNIVLGKPLADYYVDDRNLKPEHLPVLNPKHFLSTWQKVCVFVTRRCNLACPECNVIRYQSSYELTT
jgi:capsule biosynthesis phosphatase